MRQCGAQAWVVEEGAGGVPRALHGEAIERLAPPRGAHRHADHVKQAGFMGQRTRRETTRDCATRPTRKASALRRQTKHAQGKVEAHAGTQHPAYTARLPRCVGPRKQDVPYPSDPRGSSTATNATLPHATRLPGIRVRGGGGRGGIRDCSGGQGDELQGGKGGFSRRRPVRAGCGTWLGGRG